MPTDDASHRTIDSRSGEIFSRWASLREEAHDLLKTVRKLEKIVAAYRRDLDAEREKNVELAAEMKLLRAKMRSIESSRAWRVVRWLRRTPAATESREARSVESGGRTAPSPSEVVDAWLAAASLSEGPLLAFSSQVGHPRHRHVVQNWGAVALELDSTSAAFGLPEALVPSPIPRALAAVARNRLRVFLALGATDGAVRWLVPSQQEGWVTVVDLDEKVSIGPPERYLATHADIVVTGTPEGADRFASDVGRAVGLTSDDVSAYVTRERDAVKPPSRVLLEDV